MKALAISYKGMEDITSLEIKELLKIDSSVKESCVVFECSKEDLAKYCYKAQGVNRVLILLDSFKIKDYEDLSRISKIDFSKWLKNKTFAARAEIDQERQQAKESLRAEVSALAIAGAEQILMREVDKKAHNEVLDKISAGL